VETTQLPTTNTSRTLSALKPPKSALITLALFIVMLAAVYGFAYKNGYNTAKRELPANQHCVKALDDAAKALQGEKVDVSVSAQECRKNVDTYSVVMK